MAKISSNELNEFGKNTMFFCLSTSFSSSAAHLVMRDTKLDSSVLFEKNKNDNDNDNKTSK